MGSDRSGSRSPDAGLPPAALARHADGERRRMLARALHETRPRARRITAQLEALRLALAQYRERAIAVHERLVALEAAGNDNVAALRKTFIEAAVRIEQHARALAEAPDPAPGPELRRDAS
jgi:hypothetical protein